MWLPKRLRRLFEHAELMATQQLPLLYDEIMALRAEIEKLSRLVKDATE